jgi:hypothetical protein
MRARVVSRMTKEPVCGTTTATAASTATTATTLLCTLVISDHSRPNRPVGLTARISAIGA